MSDVPNMTVEHLRVIFDTLAELGPSTFFELLGELNAPPKRLLWKERETLEAVRWLYRQGRLDRQHKLWWAIMGGRP